MSAPKTRAVAKVFMSSGSIVSRQHNSNPPRPSLAGPAQRINIPVGSDPLEKRVAHQIVDLVAAEFARENADYLQRKLSKPLTATDLYMAHFLGAGGAGVRHTLGKPCVRPPALVDANISRARFVRRPRTGRPRPRWRSDR